MVPKSMPTIMKRPSSEFIVRCKGLVWSVNRIHALVAWVGWRNLPWAPKRSSSPFGSSPVRGQQGLRWLPASLGAGGTSPFQPLKPKVSTALRLRTGQSPVPPPLHSQEGRPPCPHLPLRLQPLKPPSARPIRLPGPDQSRSLPTPRRGGRPPCRPHASQVTATQATVSLAHTTADRTEPVIPHATAREGRPPCRPHLPLRFQPLKSPSARPIRLRTGQSQSLPHATAREGRPPCRPHLPLQVTAAQATVGLAPTTAGPDRAGPPHATAREGRPPCRPHLPLRLQPLKPPSARPIRLRTGQSRSFPPRHGQGGTTSVSSAPASASRYFLPNPAGPLAGR